MTPPVPRTPPAPHVATSREGERAWLVAAAGIAGLAFLGRIHNAFAYHALRDFDAAGHALNTFALYRGELPDPRSWSGFHPPLAYALGAAVWHVLPESIPVHAALRLLSLAAGAGACVLVWRLLRRQVPESDAAIAAVVGFCAPVTAIATSMMGNEALCALLSTAALGALVLPAARPVRRALWAGLFAGAATLAKSTGLLVIAAGAGHLVLRAGLSPHSRRSRRAHPRPPSPRAALAALGAFALAAGLLSGPHFARLARHAGSPLAVVSGGALSPDARDAMREQPPGERRLSDYAVFPRAALLEPIFLADGMLRSVPGLLYASTWADGHAQFLPPAVHPAILPAEAAVSLAGLLPTGLALLGAVRVLRRPRAFSAWAGALLFGVALVLAFARYAWTFPHYSAVKASYFLPALLPACLLLAVGLDAIPGRARAGLRAALLALAAASTGLFWFGWWTWLR